MSEDIEEDDPDSEDIDEGEIFPWEDVEKSRFDAKLQEQGGQEKHLFSAFLAAAKCPVCGKQGAELQSFYFESPEWTWERLCGRAGWMVVCDDCHRQVAFELTILS